jgi:hypothetical protein
LVKSTGILLSLNDANEERGATETRPILEEIADSRPDSAPKKATKLGPRDIRLAQKLAEDPEVSNRLIAQGFTLAARAQS